MKSPSAEAVVITGMAGKFPDSKDIKEFQENLFNKVDLVSPDCRRWDATHAEIPQRTGKIPEIKKFDAGFFGVHQRQAQTMDPMSRMIIENTFEAIVDAGMNPVELKGTNTGVFVGACFSESEKTSFYESLEPEMYGILGCTRSMLAKRISYWFQLEGKSFVTDTACSSSLFCLEHAFKAIKDGSCDNAIVCGCNLCLHPMVSLQFARLGVLSLDGACKSFDNAANGYARSEAICVLILQRYEKSRRMYAEIIHSKTNCDGYKEQGITYPSGSVQKVLLDDFYQECGLNPNSLTYLEAHGTGTKVGDPEELNTLAEIFCSNRATPLLIGSVKSNIGHNEPVSGLCSMIKTLIAFESGYIPPNIHYKEPRKGVEALETGRMKVVDQKVPLPDNKGLIGVNSFGFGGANCHVLIKWNEKEQQKCSDDLPRLVCVSGRTQEAIKYLLDNLQGPLDIEFVHLLHKVFSFNIPGHVFRGHTILTKFGTLETCFRKYDEDVKPLKVVIGSLQNWVHYAKQLFHLAKFAAHVKKVHNILLNRKLKLNNIQDIIDINFCPAELISVILGTGLVALLKTLKLDVASFEATDQLGMIIIDYYFNKLTLEDAVLMSLNKSLSASSAVLQKAKNNVLLIGHVNFDVTNGKTIDLITRKHNDSLRGLFDGLGKLFECGYNLKLENIYAKISYPVGRGTPMISPLIGWDHSKDWFTMVYKPEDKTKSGQRTVSFSLKDDEWVFLKGHVIDGRCLFPATGYLFLVWETLARVIGRLQTEMKVVFEEVKFLRACTVPQQGSVKLAIRIQKGSGLFEVSEESSTIVTGKVYEDLNLQDEWQSLPVPQEYPNDPQLTEKYIYKELRLRGYNYKYDFRVLKCCNLNAEYGRIQWISNWMTLIDGMFQLQILHEDTRCLFVPTRISKLSIDSTKHLSIAKNLGDNPLIPAYFYKDLNIVRCGGIELRGLWANSIAKRQQSEPVLETYKFTPYVIRNLMPVNVAVRILTQIILENEAAIQFKAVEFLNENSTLILTRYVLNALADQPVVKANMTVVSEEPIDLGPNVTVVEKLNDSDFVVSIGQFTKFNTNFVITIEDIQLEDTEDYALISSICLIEDSKILHLYRKLMPMKSATVVEIKSDFEFLEKLQNLLMRTSKIILWSSDPNSGILGFSNCIRREPGFGNERVTCFWTPNLANFDQNLYQEQISKGLAVNILKNNQWGSYRHLTLDPGQNTLTEHAYVNVGLRGDLSSLKWFQGPLTSNSILHPEEILVHVFYSAINFRDIMTATGRIQADVVTRNRLEQDCVQGFEFCGKTKGGRRVMGMRTRNAMATLVPADTSLLWDVPADWSMEQAVTIPAVYGTVAYGLIQRANIQSHESILIHSGTGGVGHAAIHMATYYRCKIFVTVGSEEKKQYIRKEFPQINPRFIGNSRDLTFLRLILKETHGYGVDVVLNSLAEEKLQTSIKCLARKGRFVEIGKYDLAADSKLTLDLAKLEASYHGVMLDALFEADPIVKRSVQILVNHGMQEGYIKPLPVTCFGPEELEEAFRFMGTGKHIGKVVIKIKDDQMCSTPPEPTLVEAVPRLNCDPQNWYFVNGGLGGFGLELCDWLVVRGARFLWVNSKRGLSSVYQKYRINIWKTYGVTVKITRKDLSDSEECVELLEECSGSSKIDAIFNLAVVLKDALYENQTLENFKQVCAPKSTATINLDKFSRKFCPQLKHFVVFSSVSCGRGNTGQTNYGLANSIMERVCEQRRQEGLPALAIQWGAIGDVGLVADMQEENTEIVIGGTLQQKIDKCLLVLDTLLHSDEAIVGSMVVAEKKSGSGGADNVVDAVVNILGLRDLKTVSLHSTFPELGMDSMMAVEIKQTLEREFDVFLSPQDIRGMTFSRLQDIVIQKTTDVEEIEDLPINVKTLFRFIADEKQADIPYVQLTLKNEEPILFLIPGVEGMATLFDPFLETLTIPSLCLQFTYSNYEETIQDIADNLTKILLARRHYRNFVIAAHSFGTVVALEVAAKLESLGHRGTLILLDGAPSLMKGLIRKQMDVSSEESFQTSLLCHLMSVYLPFEIISNYKNKLLQENTFEERIEYAMGVAPKKTPHSLEYMKKVCKVAYRRVKAVYNYQASFAKLNSRVILCKAEIGSLGDALEDYGLKDLVNGSVLVRYFEGNHVSILENVKLVQFIEEIARENFDDHCKTRLVTAAETFNAINKISKII